MAQTVLQLTRPSDQTILNATDTKINWTHQTYSLNWPSPSLPLTDITVPIDGLYLLSAAIWWTSSTIGQRLLWIVGLSATAEPFTYCFTNPVASGIPETVIGALWATVASPLSIHVYQTRGSSQNLLGATAGRAPTITLRLLKAGTPT